MGSIDITKETFFLVIQDPKSRKLMDDLEIPCERACLFDVFDADGSGSLAVKEIIQGFLRVRGDPQRSDVLAGYLSVRALLEIVRELEQTVELGISKLSIRFSQIEKT